MHVVIVGGGIVGLSCAYSLVRRGVEVTVCEQGSIGGESTQRSAGGIRTQFSTRMNIDLSLASLDVWNNFEDRFGVDIVHRQTGYLFLTRKESTAADFRENVELQNKRGGDSRYLNPSETVEYCPGLYNEGFVAATYSPLDGFADPNLAIQGYLQALGEYNVDIRTGTSVRDILVDGNGATSGVKIAENRIDADIVVNAAGPWAAHLAAMADVNLPIEPKRRQILVAGPETPIPEDVPLTIDLDTGLYFRPEREGAALIGGHFDTDDPTQEPDSYDKNVDLDWTMRALEQANGCTEYFGEETTVKRGWAGLYAVTPDHHPIIEEVIPGFIVAAGFSGHGFQHAPATGKLVAEIAYDGDTSLVDIDPLRSERFEKGKSQDERNVA